MTTAMITNKARRPALDMEALALHYRVPASTPRGRCAGRCLPAARTVRTW